MAITTTGPRAPAFSRRWVDPAARAGYATHGVLYVLVGTLALLAASGHGGGARDAERTVADLPLGRVLLALVGAGMSALAAWRFVQAARDPERISRRDGKWAIVKRIGWAVGGAVNAALGVAAFQLALPGPREVGADREHGREWVSQLLAWPPVGPVLVGCAGGMVVLFGLVQVYLAWTTDFTRHLRITEMTAAQRRWSTRIGRAGLFARGVVLTIVGIGLLQAALDVGPGETLDVGSALRDLASQPHGAALLVIVAAGLLLYGGHELVEARFHRIPTAAF